LEILKKIELTKQNKNKLLAAYNNNNKKRINTKGVFSSVLPTLKCEIKFIQNFSSLFLQESESVSE